VLKWAGGKGQLLDQLVPRARAAMGAAYHEPFLGGGALFFELARIGALPPRVTLSDANPLLVELYVTVRDQPDQLIEHLREHQARHGEAHYYAVRQQVPGVAVARAARVVYLNKTCFNGLYRVNSKGVFNVPMGSYVDPNICDEPNLRAASAALQGAEITLSDFAAVADRSRPGDFVYFDPPYDPVSPTSRFTSYARAGFGPDEQRRLRDLAWALHCRGVRILLSNSMTPLVRELYAGFSLDTVLAARSVNSRPDRRGKVEEALIAGPSAR
jgi:DNA adenine methylase